VQEFCIHELQVGGGPPFTHSQSQRDSANLGMFDYGLFGAIFIAMAVGRDFLVFKQGLADAPTDLERLTRRLKQDASRRLKRCVDEDGAPPPRVAANSSDAATPVATHHAIHRQRRHNARTGVACAIRSMGLAKQ